MVRCIFSSPSFISTLFSYTAISAMDELTPQEAMYVIFFRVSIPVHLCSQRGTLVIVSSGHCRITWSLDTHYILLQEKPVA